MSEEAVDYTSWTQEALTERSRQVFISEDPALFTEIERRVDADIWDFDR